MPWNFSTRLVAWIALACVVPGAAPAAPEAGWTTRIWSLDTLGTRNVVGVAVTSDGFLWVATPVALWRFDGTNFVRYSGRLLVGGTDFQFTRLAANGRELWAVTDQGRVLEFSPDRVTHYSGLPTTHPDTLYVDRDGAAWVTYFGGGLWHLAHGVARRLASEEGIAAGDVALARDREGTIWVAQGGKLLVWRSPRFEAVVELPGKGRVLLTAKNSGGLWVAAGSMLYQTSAAGPLVAVDADLRPIQGPLEILLDDGSGLWLATHSAGLYRLEHGQSVVTSVPVSYRYIDSLATDPFGDLWVASMGGGLSQVRRRIFSVEGGASGVPADAIQSLCEDTAGTLWGVTQNNRLVVRRGLAWTPAPTPPIPDATCVAADPTGGVWIGTRGQHLHVFRHGTLSTFGAAEGLASKIIYAALPGGANSDVWIMCASPNAVYRLHHGHFTEIPFPDAKLWLTQMAQDASGTIWVGTSKGPLLRAVGDRLVQEPECRPPGNQHAIRSLCPARDGSLLIGYEGSGVGWLKDGHFSVFGAEGDLGSRYVEDLAEDDTGRVWCGSEHGIFVLREAQIAAAATSGTTTPPSLFFGAEQGLPDLATTGVETTGALRTRDGRIWMPLGSALVIIDPGNANPVAIQPALYLTRVIVDHRPVAEYSGALSAVLRSESAPLSVADTRVQLPPGGSVQLDFACPELSGLGTTALRYRLAGFDDHWIAAPVNHSATYTRLPPGEYRFEVEAIAAADTSHPRQRDLTIVVARFYWQTWWFALGALILFTGTVAAGVRMVSHRRLRRKMAELERQAELDRERTRIARDIHDDVGNALTRIVILSTLAQRHAPGAPETGEHLKAISRSAEEVSGALDEIVWAVNPRNDSLPHLFDYLAKFIVEFLRDAGIACQLQFPDRVPDEMIPADARHGLLLVIKEAMTNVVRHSGATAATARVELRPDTLVVTIADNGRGFVGDPAKPGSDGLGNMRERMRELGGRCDIKTSPGGGTLIVIVWPRRQDPKPR